MPRSMYYAFLLLLCSSSALSSRALADQKRPKICGDTFYGKIVYCRLQPSARDGRMIARLGVSELVLRGSGIKSLAFLKFKPGLVKLTIEDSDIRSLLPLRHLSKLTLLWMHRNYKVKSLRGVGALKNLRLAEENIFSGPEALLEEIVDFTPSDSELLAKYDEPITHQDDHSVP